ncbi:MAG TPA: TonB-dependent receptor, partial [Bacteroidota bacterium]|nr:TonB-dependent receptor [Bacteroidota bacterium]
MKYPYCYIILAFFVIATASGQTREIRGRVVSATTKEPLAGAIVSLQDARTTTDSLGAFALTLASAGSTAASNSLGGTSGSMSNSPQAQLVVRYLGYQTETIRLQSQKHITIIGPLEIAMREVILPARGIVVIAEREKESETPITYSTLKAQEIKERYTVRDIPVLLSELPSTTYYSDGGNGIGYTYLNIRGFDQRRIAVMVNGVPQNDPEDHSVYWLDFPDLASNLEDIQVQRGAGSMTIGAPAIGGSINLVTTNFARRRGLYVSAGAGTFNTRKVSLSAHSGVFDDRYAIYARLSKITSDGYRDNSWVDFGSYFLGAVRFDKNMSTQINLYGGPVADHLAYYGIAKEDLSDRALRKKNPIARPEEIENFSQPHYEIINEWNVSDHLTLNNTVFYIKGSGFFDYDGSWAPYSYYRITKENGFASVTGDPDTLYIPGALIHAFVENNQYGWVPRATLVHTNGTLIVGGELRLHRSVHTGSLKWGEALPEGVTPSYTYYSYHGAKTMASVYAHELYRANDRFMVLGDLQLATASYRLYDEAYLGTDFTKSYVFLNPKFGVNYTLNDRTRIYATVSRTSREPQLKNLYDAAEASTPASWGAVTPQFRTSANGAYDFTQPLVSEETMNAAESGFGYTADAVTFHLNAYYMQFNNEIVKSGRLDRFGQPVTGNAKHTVHEGVEVSAQWQPLQFLEFSGNATYSRNRFVDHTEFASDGSPISLNGKRIAGFP